MKMILTTLALLASGALFASEAQAQVGRNTPEYNLQSGLGLKGYDPVSYFPEGGNQPKEGKTQYRIEYMGVLYEFSTAANLDLFVENPEKYEPTYGGWCAYAMASGSKVDIQPHLFTIHGNRIHFFVSRRAKQNFDADIQKYETRADGHWKQISGEQPRK